MSARQQEATRRRHVAADVAGARPAVVHHPNGDEQRVRDAAGHPTYAASFTKCLPHDGHGFLRDPEDYTEWVRSIGSGDPRDFRALRVGPGSFTPDGDFVYTPTGPQLDWSAT